MWWSEILETLVYPGVLYVTLLALFFEWVDRKLVARLQNRVGPYYAGPHGLLQPLADLLKLVSKEDIVPLKADRLLFTLCPILAMVVMLTASAFLPMAAPYGLVSFEGDLIVAIALLTIYALIVYASGIAPPSRYSLLGAERVVLMLIGFEVPLTLSCLSVAIASGSLKISDIVLRQADRYHVLGVCAPAFALFLIASQAELERVPFDIPEAETEVVAGWQVEYASWRLALFRLSRDVEMLFLSGLGATLFLGGPLGPTPSRLSWLLPPIYFLAKSILVLVLLSILRASFARIRIDQFVSFCWRTLIPVSLAYLLVVLWVV
jgi:NADH-quinone oxidoreductase subunit H